MLNAQQIEMAERITMSEEWRALIHPLLASQAKALETLALALPPQRPDPWNKLDDNTATLALKSEAKGIKWLLGFLEQEIKVARFERIQQQNGAGAGADNPAQPLAPIT